MSALLTGEALEVVDVSPGPHHHLEGWDHLVAGSAVARGAKQPVDYGNESESIQTNVNLSPQVIPLAEKKVPLGVE